MKIHVHPCQRKNIGDEFNLWFWEEVFGNDLITLMPDDQLLVGIGTVLNNKLPAASMLHILGSGVGYGQNNNLKMKNWNIHFVRGCLSAQALGIDKQYAISDPGILISQLRPQVVNKTIPISFMPHIGIDSERYQLLIEGMGWNYISPSDEEHIILQQIAASEKLITSAMHGAIIADSYRTPWLPIITSNEILPFKWHDWFSSLSIDTQLTKVPAYWGTIDSSLKSKIADKIKTQSLKSKLAKLSKTNPFYLSGDKILASKQEQLFTKLDQIKDSWQKECRQCS